MDISISSFTKINYGYLERALLKVESEFLD